MSFVSIFGLPIGITTASFSLVFSLTAGIIKKLLKITRKNEKHNKIVMLSKSQLNSIETLMSQVLTDLDISLKKLKKIKENIRNIKSSDEKDELRENSRDNKEIIKNSQI